MNEPKVTKEIKPDGEFYTIEYGSTTVTISAADFLRFIGKYYCALADELDTADNGGKETEKWND